MRFNRKQSCGSLGSADRSVLESRAVSCALSGPNEDGGPRGQALASRSRAVACAASHPNLPSWRKGCGVNTAPSTSSAQGRTWQASPPEEAVGWPRPPQSSADRRPCRAIPESPAQGTCSLFRVLCTKGAAPP